MYPSDLGYYEIQKTIIPKVMGKLPRPKLGQICMV